jgi:hypothetical protein
MDEVITCTCGNQSWVIGTSGVRCSKCRLFLATGSVVSNIQEINSRLKELKKIDKIAEFCACTDLSTVITSDEKISMAEAFGVACANK